MAAGPRAYGVAVERKLYRVAGGTCYYPDCKRAIRSATSKSPISAAPKRTRPGTTRG